jgi:AhpD family alkylhydroperoxidase
MPRVPVHDLATAPEASRDALKRLEGKFGKVINIFGEMAHAPALLGLFTSAEQAIAEHTSLDQATREAIHLAVATVNDCGYCQAAYTIACTRAGLTKQQTIAIRRGSVDFDPALDALLAVVREAAAAKGYVTQDVWQRALDAGWSDRQLLKAVADTVRTILTNYFNHYVGTEIDLPPAPDLDPA